MTPDQLRKIMERQLRLTRIVMVCCMLAVVAMLLAAWSVL